MLEVQMGGVARRARWVRWGIACLLLTVACLVVCPLAVGPSTVWRPL